MVQFCCLRLYLWNGSLLSIAMDDNGLKLEKVGLTWSFPATCVCLQNHQKRKSLSTSSMLSEIMTQVCALNLYWLFHLFHFSVERSKDSRLFTQCSMWAPQKCVCLQAICGTPSIFDRILCPQVHSNIKQIIVNNYNYYYSDQCSTLIFLDISLWASEFNKSLAHEDKPLVQEKLKWFKTLQCL